MRGEDMHGAYQDSAVNVSALRPQMDPAEERCGDVPKLQERPVADPALDVGRAVWTYFQRAAMRDVNRAIRRGMIPPIDATTICVDCGRPAKAYEHRDYARPYDVVPVCHRCNAMRGAASLDPEIVIQRLVDAEAIQLILAEMDDTLGRTRRMLSDPTGRRWAQRQ